MEIILDTSTAAKRTEIATILNGWIDECADDGFNAVEPDNLDVSSLNLQRYLYLNEQTADLHSIRRQAHPGKQSGIGKAHR
jgi:Glycoside-hydrolase family GH114